MNKSLRDAPAKSLLLACTTLLLAASVSAQTLLPDPAIVSSAAASAGFEAPFALDGNPATDYASDGLGSSTYLDFDFGVDTLITQVDYTDRRTAGGSQGTISDGPLENTTAFDLIFSTNATFGDGDDQIVPVPSAACCSTDTVGINNGSGLVARYLRFDVALSSGTNPGAAEFEFYTADPPPEDQNGQIVLTSPPTPYETSGILMTGSPNRPDLSMRIGSSSGAFGIYQLSNAPIVHVQNNGNVGIGTSSPTMALHVNGDAFFSGTLSGGSIQATFQDLAEWVPANADLPAGTVVVLDPLRPNAVVASSKAYDTTVAGVVSARPGVILGQAGTSKEQIATIGRVRVKADASQAPIAVGDLLVTSPMSGAVMRSETVSFNGVKVHRTGTIIGRALEPLESGEGEILVLLSLQ